MRKREPSRPDEVFLSHSDLDRKFAASFVTVLKRHGIKVWYSPRHIAGADEWYGKIGAALNRCDWFVVILSPNSVVSRWVRRELVFALTHERYDGRVVPVLYKDVDYLTPFWSLGDTQVIDFTRKREDGYRELLKVWGVGYRAK